MITCKCDGCGKEAPCASNGKEIFKPVGWLEKRNYPQFQGGPLYLHACSKECIDKIEFKLAEEFSKGRNAANADQ